jgi:hypothetical protein
VQQRDEVVLTGAAGGFGVSCDDGREGGVEDGTREIADRDRLPAQGQGEAQVELGEQRHRDPAADVPDPRVEPAAEAALLRGLCAEGRAPEPRREPEQLGPIGLLGAHGGAAGAQTGEPRPGLQELLRLPQAGRVDWLDGSGPDRSGPEGPPVLHRSAHARPRDPVAVPGSASSRSGRGREVVVIELLLAGGRR